MFQESIDNPDIIDFLKLTKKNKDALIQILNQEFLSRKHSNITLILNQQNQME